MYSGKPRYGPTKIPGKQNLITWRDAWGDKHERESKDWRVSTGKEFKYVIRDPTEPIDCTNGMAYKWKMKKKKISVRYIL